MFRLRFILPAVIAVAAALVAPSTSRAGFSVTFSSTDGGGSPPPVWVVNDNASGTGSFYDNSTASNYIDTGTLANGGALYNGLAVDVETETNNPGTAASGEVFTTQIRIKNTGTTTVTKNIRIEIKSTGFTGPGASGDFVNLQTILTTLSGISGSSLGSGSGENKIYTSVTGPNQSPNPANTNPDSFAVDDDGRWLSDVLTFKRGSTYDMTLILDLNLTLTAGKTVNIDAQGLVTVPAPTGLVMLATALPFAGLLRLRRRVAKPETTTAA